MKGGLGPVVESLGRKLLQVLTLHLTPKCVCTWPQLSEKAKELHAGGACGGCVIHIA